MSCSIFARDISHECKMAQPSLVHAIINIQDLPKLGFVSMSYFLDLLWGKVQLKLRRVHGIASLKNLMPFCEGFLYEEIECGSLF